MEITKIQKFYNDYISIGSLSLPRYFLSLLFVIFSGQLTAKDFYVSTSGNDNNSGTKDQPLATLEGARNAVRAFKQNQISPEAITVTILEGTYFLPEHLVFDVRDSGSEDGPIIYQGEDGKKIEFIGGRKIDNFEKVNDDLWRAQLPDVKEGNWYFEQLYVNDSRAIRARSPNLGEFYNILGVEEKVLVQGTGRTAESAIQKINVNPSIFKSLNDEPNLNSALLTFYHKWDNTRKFVHSYDAEQGFFTITGKGMKPWNFIDKESRFYIDNIKSGLDAPGEWFLENDGTLYYIPREGEEIEETTIYAPTLQQFIIIRGEGMGEKLVNNITFKNLTFKVSGYSTPKQGNEPSQAASVIGAVVLVDYAKNITFTSCEISNTGTGAVWFRKANFNNKIEQCYLHDLGAGGVKIGINGNSPAKDDPTVSKENIVDNNIIRSAGWVFPGAVGVAIFHSSDNEITHNEIADLRYTGISVGWVWGYSFSHAKRNKIKYNHIHHLGWGDLSDMGGIYTLGVSEGTEISHNVIHHVYSLTYGGWGLYTDEGSTGILMENNLVYACKSSGFHQHFGKDNIIRNNIFAYNIKAQLQASRVEKHNSFTFTHNIVYFNTGTLLTSRWDEINFRSSSNLYWDERTRDIKFGKYTFSEWQQRGKDNKSIIANPMFQDPEGFNFDFKQKSAVRQIDFKPFDYNEAGVYGEKEWVKKAAFNPELKVLFDEIVEKNEQVP
jgi:hypothetical protein